MQKNNLIMFEVMIIIRLIKAMPLLLELVHQLVLMNTN